MILIINLTFVILCIVEAYNDHYSILDMCKDDHSKQWHTAGFIYYIILAALVYYLSSNIWVIPCLGLIRLSVFPFALNLLRGKPAFYMSKKGIDGLLTKYIPSELVIIGSFALTIIITIWQ
jgi:hypothetical protein